MRNIKLLSSECDAYTKNCDLRKLYASDKLLMECSKAFKTTIIQILLLEKELEYLREVAQIELAARVRRKKCQQPIYKPYKIKK